MYQLLAILPSDRMTHSIALSGGMDFLGDIGEYTTGTISRLLWHYDSAGKICRHLALPPWTTGP
jgi:hypothetical protein